MLKPVKDANLGVCIESNCKSKIEKLNFCKEHFEQFKFGVIKITGQHPVDHEKKMGHYLAHKANRKA